MTSIFPLAFSVFTVLFNSCGQTNSSSSENIVASSDTNKIKVGNAPGSIEIADFNNDKFADLAIASETDSSITILLGNGKGRFAAAENSPFFAGSIPNDISIADFNKDGNVDLAMANHEKQYLTVLLGNGKGNFTPAPQSPFQTKEIGRAHV